VTQGLVWVSAGMRQCNCPSYGCLDGEVNEAWSHLSVREREESQTGFWPE
jgi:hypothetical protein